MLIDAKSANSCICNKLKSLIDDKINYKIK